MRFLFSLIANLFKLIFWPLRALRSARAAPRDAFLELKVDGGIVEVARRPRFWERSGPRPLALHSLRELTRTISRDPRVRGVLLVLEHLPASAGGATTESLADAVRQLRSAGKEVVAYLPSGGGTRVCQVAAGANRVIVAPETHLAPMGFAVEARYLKRVLDRLGIEAEVYARGEFKTAAEFLAADHMSEPQRRQLEALLDSSYDALVEALAQGRGVPRDAAQRWVDVGPWGAQPALEQGLVDAIGYRDELPKLLAREGREKAPIIGAGRYWRRRRLQFTRLLPAKRIGVVEVQGAIVPKLPGLRGGASLAVDEDIVDACDEARENPRVRGVVLHIDSRGGSALASDRILHAVERLAAEKPVVAWMGNVAASGGYMAAVGAPCIVAQPTTITGSIGVIAARFVLKQLAERIGVGFDTVKRGARADMMSPFRHLADDEAEHFMGQIEDSYQSFVGAVARGRQKEPAEIEELARGRVWSGRDALKHGLIDQTGGFDVALGEVRARIGAGAEKLQPEVLNKRPLPSVLELISGAQSRAGGGAVESWLGPLGLEDAAEELLTWRALAGSQDANWLWCEAVLVER